MTVKAHNTAKLSSPPIRAFSGKPPEACAGFDAATGTLHALPQVASTASRNELLAYFDNGWTLTELLFSAFTSEQALYARAYHQLRMPMIFYLAHPAVLYVNKLRVAGLLGAPVNPAFEALFETGVDEMRWDDLHEDKTDWPAVADVMAYRAQVYRIVADIILQHPAMEHITTDTPGWAVLMGFEHERIHLETSSVLMRELPLSMLQRPAHWPALAPRTTHAAAQAVSVPASTVALGKPRTFPSFGWDNEYGSEQRDVPAFVAGNQLVSNAEFLAFVKDGGYLEQRYWCTQGWQWRSFRNIKWPTFFVPDGPSGLHRYKLRTLFEVIDLPPDWPVCVNWYEAKAYARWKAGRDGAPWRLLTEAEHMALRDGEIGDANLNLRHGSESSVAAFAANRKGFHDVFGNVWQWLEDDFHPLHGGAPHPYYNDFSVPCYDGEHRMMLGGSFISCGDEASAFARFHFRPHFFQHAGFRLARSADSDAPIPKRIIRKDANAHYENDIMLGRYLHMHYAPDAAQRPAFAEAAPIAACNMPQRAAELAAQFAAHKNHALDVGCAVGRTTFELTRHFADVVGVDLSQRFVDSALQLKRGETIHYPLPITGSKRSQHSATLPPGVQAAHARFEQGDAMQLRQSLQGFDAIVIANTICRLPNPAACLNDLLSRLNAGGVLVVVSPYSWFAEFTPPEHWVEGPEDLARILAPCSLLHEEHVPMLIAEHARKFEYIVPHLSVWQKAGK